MSKFAAFLVTFSLAFSQQYHFAGQIFGSQDPSEDSGTVTEMPAALSGGWHIYNITVDENMKNFVSIALDPQSIPYVVYSVWARPDVLNLSFWNGNEWEEQTIDDSALDKKSQPSSLEIDDNGGIHISYKLYHVEFQQDGVVYLSNINGSWTKVIVEEGDALSSFGDGTSLELDKDGYPRISYSGDGDIRFASFDGTSWSIQQVDGDFTVHAPTSLALDSKDNPHMTYFYGKEKTDRYAWLDGGQWNVSSLSHHYRSSSIAIGPDDIPHIVSTGPGGLPLPGSYPLIHSKLVDGLWESRILFRGHAYGLDSAIAVDSRGYPHIAYTSSDIATNYAWWNGQYWITETIEGNISTSGRIALALDANDIPFVAYKDADTYIVRVATKANLTANQTPVADAGPDQTVNEGDTVQFDASNSSGEGQGFFGADIKVDDSPKKASFPEVKVNDAGVIHVVWTDTRDWPSQGIYYAKSTDGGKTFLPAVSVTDKTSGAKIGPAFDLGPNGWIHVAWMDVRGSSYDIYYANSKDGGLTFGDNIKVNDDSYFGGQGSPDVAVDVNGVIHVAWRDGRSHDTDIYYANSTDGGNSFNSNLRVNDYDGASLNYAVAVIDTDSNGTPHVAWEDKRNTPVGSERQDIYYATLSDSRDGFGPNVRVTDDVINRLQGSPSIVVTPADVIYLVWVDSRDDDDPYDKTDIVNISYSRSFDLGKTFTPNLRLTDSGHTYNPTLAIDGEDNLHIAWRKGRYSQQDHNATDIYYAKFMSSGVPLGEPVLVNDGDDGQQFSPSISTDVSNVPHVVWYDDREHIGWMTYHIYYAKGDGSGGQPSLHYDWDFDASVDSDGDGDFTNDPDGTGPTPTHIYGDNGIYTVTLKVTDDAGQTDTDTCIATVLNVAPTADADGPYEGNEPHTVQFIGTFSDPGFLDTHTFQWDFDYDGITFTVDSTEQNPTHQWLDDYDRDVAFKVTDDDGGWGMDVTRVVVHNVPPTVEWTSKSSDGSIIGPPYPEGEEILFEATVSDPGIYDTFTYDWDFGDGTILLDAGPEVTHTYGDDKTYTVVLTVTDDDGGVGIDDTPPLPITNEDPVPVIHLPFCIFVEGLHPCDAIGEFSDPGWLDTHSAVWEFGDGTSETAVLTEEHEPPDSTGWNITSHMYGDNGMYTLTFTVTDDDGGTGMATAEVPVQNHPPGFDLYVPITVNEGQQFVLGVEATDPGSDDLTISVDWGDGTSDSRIYYNDGVGPDPPNSGPGIYPFVVQANFTHVYPDDGDYNVTVMVEDDDGGSDAKTFQIPVLNVAPTVTLEVLPIDVEASLRIAGEKWHDVSIELYEDDVLIAEGSLTRYPGSPNDQMLDLSHLSVNISRRYSAIVRYTPEDDPVNGQLNGANPCWIILRFDDQDELWIHHTFNVQHPETYTWEVDLTAAILSHGLTFEATAHDPGADDLTFHWDFGDGTDITTFYPNVGSTYPVDITEMVTHAFLGSGTFVVTLTVEDDDGGVGTASLTIVIP